MLGFELGLLGILVLVVVGLCVYGLLRARRRTA